MALDGRDGLFRGCTYPEMKQFRTSILGLVLVVAAFAIAFAALRSGSDLWFAAIYTFIVLLLLLSVIIARFRRGDEKAFWFGFAVFGWGFFLIGFGLWINPYADFDFDEGEPSRLNPNLMTSRLIHLVVTYLRKSVDDVEDIEKITWNTIGIAHLILTLVIAILGGMIGTVARRRRGKIISVRSLAILALAAAIPAFAWSSASLRPPNSYFPKLAFDEEKDASEFSSAWYSSHLRAMGEPSLWALARKNQTASVYRLLWLPSFHHPVCVRISSTAGGARLHVKVLDGAGGFRPGLVAIERNIMLPEHEWNNLNRYLKQAGFWKMPTRPEDDLGVEDGAQLILEGVQAGTYHVVDRQIPEPAYKELCRHMLELTGLDVQAQWARYH
jgi:hypothetical protein